MKKIAKFAIEIAYEDGKIFNSPEDMGSETAYAMQMKDVEVLDFQQVGEFKGLMLAMFAGVFGVADRENSREAFKRKAHIILAFSSAYSTAFMNLTPEEFREPAVRTMLFTVANLIVRTVGIQMGFTPEEINQIISEDDQQGTQQTNFESFL